MNEELTYILETAKHLQIDRKVSFTSGANLHNGNIQFSYVEEDNTTGGKKNLTVPSEIAITIPVYKDDEPYKIDCLFRYRLVEGKLFFILKMKEIPAIKDHALGLIRDAVSEKTGIVPFYGRF